MDMNVNKLYEMVDRETWNHATVHEVTKSLINLLTVQQQLNLICCNRFFSCCFFFVVVVVVLLFDSLEVFSC